MTDPYVDIRCGDALEVMVGMDADSVDCCVTSPPYWGLRKYAGQQERVWGGKADCRHEWGVEIPRAGYRSNDSHPGPLQSIATQNRNIGSSNFCSLCGAWRGAFGLEPTPELYVAHTLEVLQAIRRVLKPWGTVWWNIGDSYWGGKGQSGYELPHEAEMRREKGKTLQAAHNVPGYMNMRPSDGKHPIIKPLDACLIPFRVALAAQADGWFVRSVIVWQKPNPMPESVRGWFWSKHRVKVESEAKQNYEKAISELESKGKGRASAINAAVLRLRPELMIDCPGCPKCSPNDGLVLRKGSWRPTDSLEYILMLAKSHEYYGDGEEVREALSPLTLADSRNATGRHTQGEVIGSKYHNGDADLPSWYRGKVFVNPESGRNLRNVWTFSTKPFSGAHFAVFPEELPRRCILASTSAKGNCPKCGMPWVRVIERQIPDFPKAQRKEPYSHGGANSCLNVSNSANYKPETETLGWKPSCHCERSEAIPAVILDPFAGSGTTGIVAKRLGRRAILIDISPEYVKMTRKSVEATPAPMRLE